MVKATFSVLSERDKQLVLETEPKRLRELDEEQLLELHGRVRRARTKHQTNYRRGAAGRVRADRARGKASAASRRDAARAEVLEEALARVSRRLAFAARAAADELRAERLAVARGEAKAKQKAKAKAKAKQKAKPAAKGKAKAKPTAGAKAKAKATAGAKAKANAQPKAAKAKAAKAKGPTPADRKRRASTKAKGKRAQARRDAR